MRSQPVHILQVLPAFESGGVERATLDMARFLASSDASGIKSSVASQGGKLVEEIERLGMDHYLLPLKAKNPLTIVKNGFELAKLVRRQGITLIHVRSRAPAWSVWITSKLTAVPFVTTFHGAYKSKSFLKKFYNSIMTRGKEVIAISQYIVGHVRSAYPDSHYKINLIYEGIDTSFFSPDRFTVCEIKAQRQKWGVGEGEKVVFLPARIAAGKGHLVAIEALLYLKNPLVKLIFVGAEKSKKLGEFLKNQIDFYGLTPQVLWDGPHKDLPLLYAASDLVLSVGTTPEAFGRVAVETAAMGKILVGTSTGATPELVDGEQSGFLVAPNNPRALADAMEKALFLSDCEKTAMETRAKHRCHHFFSLQRMGKETVALYLKTSL